MNAFQTYRNLNIVEKLVFIGYTPEEITADTYIYIDEDENICGMEKRDRRSEPEDLLDGGEYVTSYYPSQKSTPESQSAIILAETREDLRQLLAICE